MCVFRDCILKTEAETEPKTECCLGFFGIGFKNLENGSICVRVKVSIKGPPKTIIYSGKGFNSNSNSKFEKSQLKACNG